MKVSKLKKSKIKNLKKSKKKQGDGDGEDVFWTSGKLMSFIALLISVGTIFTYSYQNHLIKKHQYASVMPYLLIVPSAGGKSGGNRLSYTLEVWNNGIGPAFIKEVNISYQDREYKTISDWFLKAVHTDHPELSFSMNGIISEGFLISSSERLHLIKSNDSISANFLERIRDELEVEITYASVYDEQWTTKLSGTQPEKIKN